MLFRSVMQAFREAIGLEDFNGNGIAFDDYWFCCECGVTNLSNNQAFEAMLELEDGVRGNLEFFPSTSKLLDRWFSLDGPVKALLGCPECGDVGVRIEEIRSGVQSALESLDKAVPWSRVSDYISIHYVY